MAQIQTTIYFSSKHIAVLQSRTKAKTQRLEVLRKVLAPLPEGTVLNGLIMDEESLLKAFSGVQGELLGFKKVVFLIETTHTVYKLSMLPKVSHKETIKLIKNDFSNKLSPDKEYVVDYAIINTPNPQKKQRLVMSCAIDNALIDAYRDFFAKVGIKLARIDTAIDAAVQMLSGVNELWGREQALICVVDHYIVSLMNLLPDGEVFFSRTRLVSEGTGEAYFNEIADAVYSNVRSRKAANRNEKMDNIYIFDSNVYAPDVCRGWAEGLGFKSIYVGAKSLINADDIKEEEADQYFYNLSAGIASVQKTLDLSKYRPDKPVNRRAVRIGLTVFLIMVAVSVAVINLVVLYMDIFRMTRETNEIYDFVNAPETAEIIERYEVLASENGALAEQLARYEEYEDIVSETAIIRKSDIESIVAVLGDRAAITGIAFDSDKKNLILNCEASNSDDIVGYIGAIRGLKLFSRVDYIGYDMGQTSANSWYRFAVTCTVREVKTNE